MIGEQIAVYVVVSIDAVLMVLDVFTTNKALSVGAKEGNIIVRFLISVLGKAWWIPKLIFSFICLAGIIYSNLNSDYSLYLLFGSSVMAVIYGLVNFTNWQNYKKLIV
jgi:hypothetical protein